MTVSHIHIHRCRRRRRRRRRRALCVTNDLLFTRVTLVSGGESLE